MVSVRAERAAGPNASAGPLNGWDMKALANELHADGFKLGLYATAGFKAVYGHELLWAQYFADVGADELNIDHMCNVPACEDAPGRFNQSGINKYFHQIVPHYQQSTLQRWAAAIAQVNRTRDVLFHNCDIGCAPAEGLSSSTPRPWGEWCRKTANMWRTSGDINVRSWKVNLASLVGRGGYSSPGGWNYPDSLEVGVIQHRRDRLSIPEVPAHFSLWCVTSSPLYLGMRLDNISDVEQELDLVSNKVALAVNAAWAGFGGDMLNCSSPAVLPLNASASNYSRLPANSVWWKPLPNASAAVVLYASGGAATIGLGLHELRWKGKAALASTTGCSVRSIWQPNKQLGPASGRFEARVAAGDVVFVVLSDCQ